MKKTIILLFFLTVNVFSQNIMSNFATIDYNFTMKVGSKFITYKSNLKCNPTQSFFQVSNEQSKDKTEEVNGETVIYKSSKSIKDAYYIYNMKLKTLDMICEIGGKDFKVKESLPEMNWVLSNDNKEVKKINEYNCNKATLNFRGRNFIAWYTTKIPVSFGPFKFRGLPGLILEIYDVNKEFSWTATKMSYPVAVKVDLTFLKKMKPKEITLKDWVEKSIKLRDLQKKMMLKKMPKGVVVENSKTENHSLELKYEWEADEQKKIKR